MRSPIVGFILGNLFLLAIACAGAGTFYVLYSALVWWDLPDVPHGIVAVVIVAASVTASAKVAIWLDRRFLNPPYRSPSSR